MDTNGCEKNGGYRNFSSLQRRTQSIDEFALQKLAEDVYGLDDNFINGRLKNTDLDSVNIDDSNYVCAPLPKTNNRPSASTCWRSRRVFAPAPKPNFGPKGTLKNIQINEQIVIQDPSSQRLHWISSPNDILIIRKPDTSTIPPLRILVVDLLKRGLKVYIDPSDHTRIISGNDPDLLEHAERCIAFDQTRDLPSMDLVICLGGDGTLLHASSLFQRSCPPILSFSMGSLGFLTPFDFKNHEKILDTVLAGNVAVLLRSRLNCTIIKEGSDDAPEVRAPHLSLRPNDTVTSNNEEDEIGASLALNEVVIDRGPNAYLSNVDLYINDRFITKVQGDGLIISTPTGSTAYAMAAGASMVHPNVPAIVICPICPHSLSFRPIVVPAGIELKVKLSADSRLSAWLSVDGKSRIELNKRDSIKITTSVYSMPSICQFDQLGDWFESLADILHWNLRKTQKRFDADADAERDEGSLTSVDKTA